MDEKALLEAISERMGRELFLAMEPVYIEMREIRANIAELKHEQTEMKREQAEMKREQAEMKREQAEIRKEVRTLNQNVAVVETKVLHELKLINEGLIGWNERNEQIDLLESKYEAHNDRIWALEQVVKASNA